MCGRFSIAIVIGLYERFRVPDPGFTLISRYNIAPTQEVPVILPAQGSVPGNLLEMMQWGLVPSWSMDPRQSPRPINARSDTLAGRAMFRDLVKYRRCLLPATGFYEWKSEKRNKVPYYLRTKDGSLFAFAGLYDRWNAPDGTVLSTCTIITTGPNAVVAPLHDRMPAILLKDDEDAWLHAGTVEQATRLLQPYPAEQMVGYPVSTAVNSPANEGEALIRPIEGFFS